MNNFEIILVSLKLFLSTEALKCMTCYGSRSLDECNIDGHVLKCMPNQNSCETVVRRNIQSLFVVKRCKEKAACKNNQLQNMRTSGSSTQCNSDQLTSFCTCCCFTDMCNGALDQACASEKLLPTVTEQVCLPQQSNLPHGNIECFGGNKLGSVCEYQCTGVDYYVHPVGHETNVCLRNGTWKYETPCCARPCPPYFLVDFMDLMHTSRPNSREFLIGLMENFLEVDAFGEDAVKVSTLYFSGTPLESSVVKFNEYDANETKFFELFKERLFPVNEGQVNIGAAIQYAVGNLLTTEAGMRDARVTKSITVITDRNSDDDAVGPAQEARRRGVVVHVVGIESKDVTLDKQKLIEIAGSEELLVLFDADKKQFKTDALPVIVDYYCKDPCDHVLHDHQ